MSHTARGKYFRGTALDRALIVTRRAHLWARRGIVFIHVPKAAGTSISEALYGRFMGHVRATDVLRWAPRSVRSLPRVAVVRNPWARLVSAYRFVRRGAGIGGPHAGRVWHAEQYQTPEFSTFGSFVNWLSSQNVRKLDQAFRPQILFVCDSNGDVIVDHLGRVESLEATHRFLEEHVRSLPPFSRSNRSGDPVDYRSFYTPELIEQVGRIYADDVRVFGYDFDDD